MKFFSYSLSLLLVLFISTTIPIPASAATLTLSSQNSQTGVGKPLFVIVRLNSEQSALNVVEGSISIPQGVIVDSLDTSGSAFSLWAQKPEYSIADKAVVFAGGAPKGITPSSDVVVFTIRAHALTKGEYFFTPQSITGYKNDGKGTRESLTKTEVKVTVSETGSAQSVPSYATRTPLIVDSGYDTSLFDGAHFIAFYGGDSGHGVSHYLVKEGLFGETVRADNFYVLKDQSLSTSLLVTAVDGDGHSSFPIIVLAKNPWTEIALSVIAIIVLFFACRYGVFLLRKKHAKKSI